jgi:hypothetical protein
MTIYRPETSGSKLPFYSDFLGPMFLCTSYDNYLYLITCPEIEVINIHKYNINISSAVLTVFV